MPQGRAGQTRSDMPKLIYHLINNSHSIIDTPPIFLYKSPTGFTKAYNGEQLQA
jgi:hypothetical protein